MDALLGLLCSLLGIGIFVLGFWFGKEVGQPKKVVTADPTEEEMNQIQEERRRLIEDQEAFRNLMNYNADMAYGVTGNKL